MKSRIVKKAACALCSAVLALGVLTACSSQPSTSATSEQQANRTYMSQVNQTMENLNSDLEGFTDAVSRNDLVNMQTKADSAFKELDNLNSLDVPDGMSEIQADYVEGTTKLRQALSDYIALFTDVSQTTGTQIDQDTYNSRMAAIQQEYDDGVAALKAGDTAAADMK